MISKGNISIDKDAVLASINDAELASFYINGLTKIPEVLISPLRDDTHPSLSVYSPDGIKIKWYDFATQEGGSMVDFVMKLYHCSYDEAIRRIYTEYIVERKRTSSGIYKSGRNTSVQKQRIGKYHIRTQMKEWSKKDFEYWESYGVPKKWLLHADIYPIAYIFIINDIGFTQTIKADEYAYTFVERKDGICTEKVYQPYNKEGYKWRSGHDRSVIDLWSKLPEKGNCLIITSSRKDALCLWAQTGIPSISPQGEATEIKAQVMQELKDRFKHIFVLFDNDQKREKNYGRIDGEKIAAKYNLIQIEIPSEYNCKDPSDLYHTFGKQKTIDVITSLIKNNLK